ncbi:MAG: Glycosyl transferase family 2 [Parcubacteria group bacterium GW2011_GWF1_43_9]|nr:MAG: Glycosyl transferase family 2 [Parcubacteria group bacterium GW2011_GWF1_43_9]
MQTAIVIVSFNGRKWLGQCLKSCQTCAPDVPIYVVDNASTDGSAEIAATFPEVTLLRQELNRGFAGGNNAGLRAALNDGAEAVMLLNQDAVLSEGCLPALEKYLAEHPQVAGVQPAIMLPDGRVNSLGNSFHFLGFGESGGSGLSLAEAQAKLPWLKHNTEPPYLSGAAVLLRAEALKQAGLFYEELFMYHEDLELSLRLRVAGWQLAVAPQVKVIHFYEPARSRKQYYYMERNRLIVWYEVFSWRTVCLLLPIYLVAEPILLLMSVAQGWLGEKLHSYGYFFRAGSWLHIMVARRRIKRLRCVSDKHLMALAAARISYQTGPTAFITRWFWNPLSSLAWAVFKPLIRW